MRFATATGIVLVAGGLVALALLPGAGWGWTVPPQLLIGAGLGLAVAALTEWALAGHSEQVVQGGWTIASRHAGVVVGLLLLAPVLTSALDRNEQEALYAGAAAVLDSEIPPLDKLRVAQDVLVQVDRRTASCPTSPPRSRIVPTTTSTGRCSRPSRTSSTVRSPTPSRARSRWLPFLRWPALASVVVGLRRRA